MVAYTHNTVLTPELRAKVAAETFVSTTARPDARKPRFRDVAGIRLVDDLDSLSHNQIHATQQHSRATSEDITTDAIRTALRGAHEIHEVIVNPRCLDFEVQRADTDQFPRTQRGKVPVLYQAGI